MLSSSWLRQPVANEDRHFLFALILPDMSQILQRLCSRNDLFQQPPGHLNHGDLIVLVYRLFPPAAPGRSMIAAERSREL